MRVARSVGRICVAVTILGLALSASAATAQVRDSTQIARDSLRAVQDSIRADSVSRAADAAVGLPSGPSRAFPASDSIIQELLRRPGFRTTRYAADSLTFQALVSQIDLRGSALVERDGSTLEADSIRYMQDACFLDASGNPKLFNEATAVVGEEMDYDTCLRRGVVSDAITAFNQLGVKWYMRGDLSVDSASTRMYAGEGSITSSDLPVPDYHFAVGRTKYVTNNIMVARPVILYVRDVPVMWLPFIFQDMREGRRSGILVPRFGINDIVRPNEGYKRHITNIGYYFAINEYLDFQASLDWFAETSVSINTQLRYNWLDRFMTGSLGASRVFESSTDDVPGRQTTRINWNHQQQFNQRTRLSAAVDFATSTRVLRENSVDPFLQTGNLRSTINFSKRLDWPILISCLPSTPQEPVGSWVTGHGLPLSRKSCCRPIRRRRARSLEARPPSTWP